VGIILSRIFLLKVRRRENVRLKNVTLNEWVNDFRSPSLQQNLSFAAEYADHRKRASKPAVRAFWRTSLSTVENADVDDRITFTLPAHRNDVEWELIADTKYQTRSPAWRVALRGGAENGMEARSLALFKLRKRNIRSSFMRAAFSPRRRPGRERRLDRRHRDAWAGVCPRAVVLH